MKHVAIRLDDDKHLQLRELALRRKSTIQELVSLAIDDVLEGKDRASSVPWHLEGILKDVLPPMQELADMARAEERRHEERKLGLWK